MPDHPLAVGLLTEALKARSASFQTAVKEANRLCELWQAKTAEARQIEADIEGLEAALATLIGEGAVPAAEPEPGTPAVEAPQGPIMADPDFRSDDGLEDA